MFNFVKSIDLQVQGNPSYIYKNITKKRYFLPQILTFPTEKEFNIKILFCKEKVLYKLKY